MNRSLKLSMLLALALGSSQAAALELGQIQVKSALGQPLLAEIPVNPDSPAELQNLTARLASAEDAAQAGVAAGPTIPLQFAVVDGANGKKVIRITSAAPVNDPYLDLLVEVNNAAGRSLREFTILLDPPGSAAGNVPATRAPTQSAGKSSHRATATPPAASSSESTAAAQAPAEPKPAKPAPAPRAAAGGSITVERGQTLSGIARETAPQGVDMNQMLLALKTANPDAFYRDNINALKSGAVLRVPGKDDAQAMAVAAAAAEVQRQNSDWRSGAARTPTTVADAGTRANATSAPTKAGPSGDHLALVPAKEGSDNAAGHGGKGDKAAAEKGMATLHQDLLRSQEALTSLTKQGDELKSRLKDLEDINGKNERLLSLKDSEIAELQHKLADARKAAGQPAGAATASAAAMAAATPAKAASTKPAEEQTVVKANEPAAAASAPATAAASASSTSAPAKASSAPVAAAKPTPAKPAAKPVAKSEPAVEEEPWFMQTWAWGAGAAVILLGLFAALRGRGRKNAAAGGAAGASSLADRFGTIPQAGGGSADPDQDELLDQLAEHPDDVGLHLELVSLYYSRRDVDHFEAAAEAMHAHITDPQQPEWVDVMHMGEDLVPEHPLFAHGVPHFHARDEHEEHEALDQFDLGAYAEEHNEIPPIPTPSVQHAPKVSGYHFDFDLTPPRQAQAGGSAAASSASEHEEHDAEASTWHFDEPEADEAQEPAHESAVSHVAHSFEHEANLEPEQELSHDLGGHFTDDPVDTKLDLARAYLDMGDPDGAQAMLEEVMHEGTQMQKDVAKRLLENIR
jgi:pilus assembly protein FimV